MKLTSSNILPVQALTIISFCSTSVSSVIDNAKCLSSVSGDGMLQKNCSDTSSLRINGTYMTLAQRGKQQQDFRASMQEMTGQPVTYSSVYCLRLISTYNSTNKYISPFPMKTTD